MAVRVGRATEVWLASQTATTNIDVNVGFTPTAGQYACIVFCSGASSATDATGAHNIYMGWGFATSASSRRCCYGYAATGQASSSTSKGARNDAILGMCDNTATQALLDFGGEITNGVRFTVDDQLVSGVDIRFSVVVIDGLTGAGLSDVLSPAATGNFTHTLPIADPELLLFLNPGPFTSFPFYGTSLQLSFGAAHADGQFLMCQVSRNSQPTMSTSNYSQHLECAGSLSVAGAPVERISKKSGAWSNTVSGTTLSLDCSERQGTNNIHCVLSMLGIEATVVNALTQTDTTTPISLSGLGNTCLGGLVVSTCEAESTQDAGSAHHHWSMGSFVSTSSRGAHGTWDENGVADSDSSTSVDYDAVYTNISTTSGQQGTMDVSTMDSGSYVPQLIMDDADPAQKWFAAVLFADVIAAGGGRTTKNTRSWPLGTEIGMGFRMPL